MTTLTAKILGVGVPNENGHVYPPEAVQAMIEQAEKRISAGALFGELGMPLRGTIDLYNVSHQITNLRVQGDTVVADIKVLKTPQGEILKGLLEDIDFRTRGYATLSADGVVSDYQLVSIDAVSDGA
jgi:hypothetical protein